MTGKQRSCDKGVTARARKKTFFAAETGQRGEDDIDIVCLKGAMEL